MKFTFAPESKPLDGFTIKRAIHRGGFGEVYYALSDGGKEVALKLLHNNLEVELRGIAQCLNLKHPNLVTIFDSRTDADGDHWIIMEYVSGRTLEQVLADHPHGMPVEEVRKWLSGIAAGLDFLHDRGIVHRDLKPANIYSESSVVKIGDVGLAKFISESRRSAQTESVGTVYYMAPEVARGRYGREVDLYSLGVMLYEMLTGRVPFDGESTAEILMKHLTEQPDLSPIPPRLRPVLARVLAKDPQRRTPTVSELEADFQRAVRGESVAPAAADESRSDDFWQLADANGHAQDIPEEAFVNLDETIDLANPHAYRKFKQQQRAAHEQLKAERKAAREHWKEQGRATRHERAAAKRAKRREPLAAVPRGLNDGDRDAVGAIAAHRYDPWGSLLLMGLMLCTIVIAIFGGFPAVILAGLVAFFGAMFYHMLGSHRPAQSIGQMMAHRNDAAADAVRRVVSAHKPEYPWGLLAAPVLALLLLGTVASGPIVLIGTMIVLCYSLYRLGQVAKARQDAAARASAEILSNYVPPDREVPAVAAAVPGRKASPNGLRTMSRRRRMAELTGSMTMAALFTVVMTSVLAVVAPQFGDGPRGFDPALVALFGGVTLVGTWLVLAVSKLTEGTGTEATTRRLLLLGAGALLGVWATWLQTTLLVHIPEGQLLRPMFSHLGQVTLLDSLAQPTLAGYVLFFGGLFAMRRWWWHAHPFRKRRFRVASVLLTLLLAYVLTTVWAFPQVWGLMWAVTISSIVHLSSPWFPPHDRQQMIEGEA